MAVGNSLLGAHSTIPPGRRIVRQYHNATSSAVADTTTTPDLELPTSMTTTQITNDASSWEASPSMGKTETDRTDEPTFVATPDQSLPSTVLETTPVEQTTPIYSAPLLTSPMESTLQTSTKRITPARHVYNHGQHYDEPSTTHHLHFDNRKHEQITIPEFQYSHGGRRADPTAFAHLYSFNLFLFLSFFTPSPHRFLCFVYFINFPDLVDFSTFHHFHRFIHFLNILNSPNFLSFFSFLTFLRLFSFLSFSHFLSLAHFLSHLSPLDCFNTETATADIEHTQSPPATSVSTLATASRSSTSTNLTTATGPKQPAITAQSSEALAKPTSPNTDHQKTAESTLSGLGTLSTSSAAAASGIANKAYQLQTDVAVITEIGAQPTQNATLTTAPDTRSSIITESASLTQASTKETSNQQTTNSSFRSKLSTQAGSPTNPKATRTSGTPTTGSTPDSPNDVFANTGYHQTTKQKATIAGAAVGAIGFTGFLGVAIFKLSSRMGRKMSRDKYRRWAKSRRSRPTSRNDDNKASQEKHTTDYARESLCREGPSVRSIGWAPQEHGLQDYEPQAYEWQQYQTQDYQFQDYEPPDHQPQDYESQSCSS
ncbi:hypothetical protein NLG97_g4870 [Lecanicillium saksenae]|uniref:Uncharacterized protein n=1 Tax=Lecanicillium saksenae TaxID=468837 RepID=A0ACC1QVS4_9HYPO|nr:hypothetical protein NLG97_g4870 [Lecanicillium saksenae]